MLAGFHRYLTESGKAENTVKSYCLTIKGFLLWYQGIRGQFPKQLALSAPVIKCKKTPRKKCNFVAEVRKKR